MANPAWPDSIVRAGPLFIIVVVIFQAVCNFASEDFARGDLQQSLFIYN